jgi:hypothetical protein
MPLAADIPTWVGAVGTILAVVAALFLQLALPWFRRPRLELVSFDISQQSGDRSLVTAADKPSSKAEYSSLWFRLRVENSGRGDAARNAQVTVTRVRRIDGEELGTVIPTRPLKWADLPRALTDIPAGVIRHVDVASLRRQPGVKTNGRLRLELFPRDDHDLRHWLKPGTYQLELVVSADGVRPRFYSLELTVDFSSDKDADQLYREQLNPIGELRLVSATSSRA